MVDGLRDFGEQVAGDHDGAAGVGLTAQEGPEPVHAFGVETVGGLVEDEHRRLAEEGSRQAEALAHAEGEPADTSVGIFGHGDLAERVVDTSRRQSRAEARTQR